MNEEEVEEEWLEVVEGEGVGVRCDESRWVYKKEGEEVVAVDFYGG